MTPKHFKACVAGPQLAANTKNILLVDDSSTSRMASRMLLATRGSSYVLTSACDGAEGVEKAIAERPDLILMDIEMPRMNGLEACRLLKQNKATRNIPVILLSMRGEDSFVEQGYASGCADFLAKPMKEHELMAAIERQLGL
jgi:CheY-like chemotaxis protein